MKKSMSKSSIINIGFYGGLVIKAINGFIEFVGGILMLILSHEGLNSIIRLITLPELTEDPDDAIMNYLVTLGQNFSINSQHSVAFYMLFHGATKLIVIWLLLKKKLWAYPLAVVIFGFFIAYEIYSYMHSHSVFVLSIIVIDIAIVAMIALEYKTLKMAK
ncbi:MAG: DUF2127 domain-containing protein [Proteocatella sp.]